MSMPVKITFFGVDFYEFVTSTVYYGRFYRDVYSGRQNLQIVRFWFLKSIGFASSNKIESVFIETFTQFSWHLGSLEGLYWSMLK
jgi:hypothetical protein